MQTEAGQKIEGGTLEWWLSDKHNPLASWLHAQTPGDALLGFAEWLVSKRTSTIRIWANSPIFDIAILGEMYRIHTGVSTTVSHQPILDGVSAVVLPWNYWELRDYRTAVHCLSKPAKAILKGRPVAHQALQDAMDQAQVLIDFGFFERYTEE